MCNHWYPYYLSYLLYMHMHIHINMYTDVYICINSKGFITEIVSWIHFQVKDSTQTQKNVFCHLKSISDANVCHCNSHCSLILSLYWVEVWLHRQIFQGHMSSKQQSWGPKSDLNCLTYISLHNSPLSDVFFFSWNWYTPWTIHGPMLLYESWYTLLFGRVNIPETLIGTRLTLWFVLVN